MEAVIVDVNAVLAAPPQLPACAPESVVPANKAASDPGFGGEAISTVAETSLAPQEAKRVLVGSKLMSALGKHVGTGRNICAG